MGVFIDVDGAALRGESQRIARLADELERGLRDARRDTALPYLPDYARQAGLVVRDVQAHINQLRVIAGLLAARSVLAFIAAAPGMSLYAKRLEAFERSRPGEFEAALMQAMQSELKEQFVGTGTKRGLPLVIKALERVNIKMTTEELNIARTALMANDAEFRELYATITRNGVRAMLAIDWGLPEVIRRLPAYELQVRAGKLDALINSSGIGIAIDVFTQWSEDRDRRLGLPQRSVRVGAAVAGGILGGLAAKLALRGACSANWACNVAAAVIGGWGGNYASGKVNRGVFPTEQETRDKRDKQTVERLKDEFHKIEQWYIDTAGPRPDWLEDRVAGTTKTTWLRQDTVIESFHRPWDGQIVAEREISPGGKVRTTYFDEHEQPINR
ncbi:hypothetical protein OJ998_19845 [Solirubrobacter taibaiensis]|nr:hypothetical protein [Solirubrobacter taibaiensis]